MKRGTVLVSGGGGYIGSHTTVELINAGLNVVVADNLSNSDMSGVEGVRKITGVDVPFVNVDCCDKEAFRKVFEEFVNYGAPEEILYSSKPHIGTDKLPGLIQYAYAQDGFLCVPLTGGNQENAMKFLRILCRDMITAPPEETAADE